MERRNFIKLGLSAGAMLGLSNQINAANSCGKTPAQTEGPFYPVLPQSDKDWDLTAVQGKAEKALGEEIIVLGQVVDQNCNPVENALVEIWQACTSGKYNHPNDPNPAPLDPNFQYWGRALTDKNGSYLFRTILPGAYPADETWVRPPHIHYKIQKRGYMELITQLYFSGDALNDADKILARIPKSDRSKVVRPIEERTIAIPGEGLIAARVTQFDITIEKLV